VSFKNKKEDREQKKKMSRSLSAKPEKKTRRNRKMSQDQEFTRSVG